ncbi:MAG TPA: stage II sporulation protein D [Bacillales bacterium]|nr:stage II sporulation protein D [Bacillales bacterium]
MKPYFIAACLILGFVLVVPAAIVVPFSNDGTAVATPPELEANVPEPQAPISPFSISVYRTSENEVETVPLEKYVVGVVASEMPANFELEALKAQALAARTYIVHYLLNPPDLNLPDGAQVTDTPMNQVYNDPQQLKEIWGADYDWKIAKIRKAVDETRGQIITYNGKPITVAFFSTSNGYTESADAYWQNALPYLQSVPSPWDRQSPKFASTETIPTAEVEAKLGVSLTEDGKIGEVLKTTPGHRVGEIKIDGTVFSGREVRETLNLRSTDFSMTRQGDEVIVRTKGWGHGVGMSQYGANGLAGEGKTYKQIVKYYYRGVSISDLKPYTAKLTAVK